jgi:hypothetical protein
VLGKVRCCFVLIFFLAFLSAGGPLLFAQDQGSPPASNNSAASNVKPAPGTRASPSTVGPNGYSNVLQPFLGDWSGNPWSGDPFLLSPPAKRKIRPPLAPVRHRRHDDKTGLVVVPVYIPYAVGYAMDEGKAAPQDGAPQNDDAEADSDYPAEKGQFSDLDDMNDSYAQGEPSDQMAPEVPPDPVVVQPATVLVFKDGRRSDVVNYAIVGDTLFDFDEGATRKIMLADLDLAATGRANEVRGVEFNLPPASHAGTALK